MVILDSSEKVEASGTINESIAFREFAGVIALRTLGLSGASDTDNPLSLGHKPTSEAERLKSPLVI